MLQITLKPAVAFVSFFALLSGCSDIDSGGSLCDNAGCGLAASLSSDHTPANEALLLSLTENELGSEPFYLVEYWRLDQGNPETETLLAQYDESLASQLELVGARIAVDNAVFRQPNMHEGREWNRVRVISYPSPQAFLDVIETPTYQQAIRLKHQATLALQSLWVETIIAFPIVDPFFLTGKSSTTRISLQGGKWHSIPMAPVTV